MTNKHLNKIAKKYSIEKKISYHLSRHSFAVIDYNYGMPIISVSKIIRNTNIFMRQIYAKVILLKLVHDISLFE